MAAAQTHPSAGGFERVSTLAEHPRRRFEYWRALHPGIAIEVAEKNAGGDFRAERVHCDAPDGSAFGVTFSDDVVTRFARPESDFVLFSLALSGVVHLSGRGAEDLSARNGLVVLDSARPYTAVSKGYGHVYLTVPRCRVLDSLDHDRDVLGEGILRVPPRGIARILQSHLLAIAREGEGLSPDAARAAVGTAVDLALATLAQLPGACAPDAAEEHPALLYAAACRFIDLHFSDPNLTSEGVARALGCSRSRLYRVFAERGEGIAGRIRRVRLERARAMLSSAPVRSIEQVAYACGFGNAASFSRAFRDFAGVTPSDHRAIGKS